MKTIVILSLALSACVASATRIGNGNDEVFALQRLQEQNPSLSREQILIKAFHESSGRVPPINFDQCKNNVEYANIMKNVRFVGFGLTSGEIHRENDLSIYVVRACYDDGPLLGNKKSNPILYVGNRVGEISGFSTGLVVYDDHRSKRELRQYNNKIVIYAVSLKKDGELCSAGNPPVEGFCYIGYAWVD
jgi:hypothetical protein